MHADTTVSLVQTTRRGPTFGKNCTDAIRVAANQLSDIPTPSAHFGQHCKANCVMFVKVYVLVIFKIVTKHGLPTHGIGDVPEESLSEFGRCINVREVGLWRVNHARLQVVSPKAVAGVGMHPSDPSFAQTMSPQVFRHFLRNGASGDPRSRTLTTRGV
jgi:hypothetical protein